MWVDHPTRGFHPFQNLSQHAPDCAPNCFSHQASFGFHYRNLQITPSLSITLQRHQKTQGVFFHYSYFSPSPKVPQINCVQHQKAIVVPWGLNGVGLRFWGAWSQVRTAQCHGFPAGGRGAEDGWNKAVAQFFPDEGCKHIHSVYLWRGSGSQPKLQLLAPGSWGLGKPASDGVGSSFEKSANHSGHDGKLPL